MQKTNHIDNIIKTHPVVFVTRDIERAMGRKPGDGYYVITNSTPYAESIKLLFPEHVYTVTNDVAQNTESSNSQDTPLDTIDILELESTSKIIESITKSVGPASILVFKNTSRIEQACKDKGWNLLNPNAKLADQIESKISQVEWLKANQLDKYLPEHFVSLVSEIKEEIDLKKIALPYVIQFNHGHTGESTIFIKKNSDLNKIATDFPKREARVTKFVNGPMFTVNCVAGPGDSVTVGNISYQITGLHPFTDREGTTVGNDWALTGTVLDDQAQEAIHKMATDIGNKLSASGWKGLFGIDVVFDFTNNTPYLIEINARQPASTTYESIIQAMFKRARETDGDISHANELTIFDTHLMALLTTYLGENSPNNSLGKTTVINDGAQIIQRATGDFIKTSKNANKNKSVQATINLLRESGFGVIEYMATEANGADVLRIQSPHGIMSGHELFNPRGKIIKENLEAVLGTMTSTTTPKSAK